MKPVKIFVLNYSLCVIDPLANVRFIRSWYYQQVFVKKL